MRYRLATTGFAVALALVLQVALRAVEEEDCKAPPEWFPKTPKPTYSKPDPDSDCDFYKWAWQTFLYVTQSESDTDPTPRFLTYQTPSDIFPPVSTPRFANRNARKSRLLLAPRFAKQNSHSDLQSFLQADSLGVVVDSNGRVLYYAQHMNADFVKFIDDHHFRDVANIYQAPADLEFPKGCLELKSSWKILGKDDDASSFYVTDAEVAVLSVGLDGKPTINPDKPPRPEKVALVGLHVVGVVDGHPEFIWSTFEHRNNAPNLPPTDLDVNGNLKDPNKPVDAGKKYTFYPTGTKAGDCNKKQPLKFKSEADQTFEPSTPLFRHFPFGEDTELDKAVGGINDSVKDSIDKLAPKLSVWKNYYLSGAVWLNNPGYFKEGLNFAQRHKVNHDPNTMPKPADLRILGGEQKLSNTTMETFTQRTRHNCFSCHQTIDDVKNGELIFPGKRIGVSHILKNAYVNAQLAAKVDLDKAETDWATALQTNDPLKVRRFLTEGFQFTGPDGTALDRAQYLDGFKSGKVKITSVTIENKDQNQTIRVQERSATVTRLVTIKGSVNGQDISGPYQLTDAWVKHGSQWLAAARQQKKAPGP